MKTTLILTGAAALCFLGIPTARAFNLYVPSNPVWTDAGISLNTGDTVGVTASGSWTCGPGEGWFGPDGYQGAGPTIWDRFFDSGVNQGRLIAYVGPDPYQGHWGDGSFFPQSSGYYSIGSSGQFASNGTGELWLGFNDGAVSKVVGDNLGAVTAQVTVTTVPEPAGSLLVLLAGTFLCVGTVRKNHKPGQKHLGKG